MGRLLDLTDHDPTAGWYTLKSAYWSMYRWAVPSGWGVAGLFLLLDYYLYEFSQPNAVLVTFLYIAMLPLLYLLLWWAISQASDDQNRSYKIPFEMALARIEALLGEVGEEYAKCIVDKQWFSDERERAGIPKEVLEWKGGRPMVVLEMSKGRYISVYEHPWKDLVVAGVALWPVKGEAAASLEALKLRIDEALGAPSL